MHGTSVIHFAELNQVLLPNYSANGQSPVIYTLSPSHAGAIIFPAALKVFLFSFMMLVTASHVDVFEAARFRYWFFHFSSVAALFELNSGAFTNAFRKRTTTRHILYRLRNAWDNNISPHSR
jgi:hypothetical protein